jgi:HlyD family secretion protein
VSVRPGDLVQANQPILRVLRADDLWVKVFVPETKLGLIPLNKEVEVRIDSFPDKRLHGVVIQKASISEFTPRNVQSVDERRYQVFAVKVRVDDPQGVLNAGMAAEVTIPLN